MGPAWAAGWSTHGAYHIKSLHGFPLGPGCQGDVLGALGSLTRISEVINGLIQQPGPLQGSSLTIW